MWRSRYYVNTKFDFSPIFLQSLVLKPIVHCLHFIKKVFDASGFPVITSYLRMRFTNSEGNKREAP